MNQIRFVVTTIVLRRLVYLFLCLYSLPFVLSLLPFSLPLGLVVCVKVRLNIYLLWACIGWWDHH